MSPRYYDTQLQILSPRVITQVSTSMANNRRMKSAMRELEKNVKKDGDNKDDSPTTTPKKKKFVNTG